MRVSANILETSLFPWVRNCQWDDETFWHPDLGNSNIATSPHSSIFRAPSSTTPETPGFNLHHINERPPRAPALKSICFKEVVL